LLKVQRVREKALLVQERPLRLCDRSGQIDIHCPTAADRAGDGDSSTRRVELGRGIDADLYESWRAGIERQGGFDALYRLVFLGSKNAAGNDAVNGVDPAIRLEYEHSGHRVSGREGSCGSNRDRRRIEATLVGIPRHTLREVQLRR
jgi:hypothetical protein